MSKKAEEGKVAVEADISNPRDVQGIMALMFGGGFLAVAVAAVFRAASFQDVLSVVKEVSTLVAVIVAFYFGKKAAEGT